MQGHLNGTKFYKPLLSSLSLARVKQWVSGHSQCEQSILCLCIINNEDRVHVITYFKVKF